MKKNQKRIAMVAVGAVLLYLVYRWYQGNQASSSTTGAVAPGTADSSGYASLAGQEQGDVAALQGQNASLLSQEQADIAGLQSQIAGIPGPPDMSGIQGQIAGLIDQINAGQNTGAGGQSTPADVPAIASGNQPVNRQTVNTIQTHRGGPFYNYYVQATGHRPPANVATSSFLYQAWKSGAKLQPAHPSTKNTQIQHPNGNHAQQTHTKPSTQHKPPATTQPKVTTAPKKAPTKPPPKTKPKASGKRK